MSHLKMGIPIGTTDDTTGSEENWYPKKTGLEVPKKKLVGGIPTHLICG
jgi:hypothetical protein